MKCIYCGEVKGEKDFPVPHYAKCYDCYIVERGTIFCCECGSIDTFYDNYLRHTRINCFNSACYRITPYSAKEVRYRNYDELNKNNDCSYFNRKND